MKELIALIFGVGVFTFLNIKKSDASTYPSPIKINDYPTPQDAVKYEFPSFDLNNEPNSPYILNFNSSKNDAIYNNAIKHIIAREGYRLDAYYDTASPPVLTVGYGHRVLPWDFLSEGDTITPERAEKFLRKDAEKAYKAALSQSRAMGTNNGNFIVALTAVNYQLGTGWIYKFPSAWRALKNGDYNKAIEEIKYTSAGSGKYSAWHSLTPVRTNDFINAIKQLS